MKKLLTLVLCWLLAFSAIAETTFKAKTAASVAGGYVTSLNKVDGSFEDGSTQWSASVGTIVPTASTEFQGNKYGLWSGTGTGTLDLQWTATASNTYEASAQVDVQGEDDVYVCAYVGTTETGCKLIPAFSKIQKVSVVADSVMSSAFYLRLKHTGSDAFNVKVDDGKIEPWTPQAVNLVKQGSAYHSDLGSTLVSALNIGFNLANINYSGSFSELFDVVNESNTTNFYAKTPVCVTSLNFSSYSAAAANTYYFTRVNGSVHKKGNQSETTSQPISEINDSFCLKTREYFSIGASSSIVSGAATTFSITASAISENVVQSWQDGMATTATLSYAQVNALTGNQGLGAFTAGYVSYSRDGEFLNYSGKLTLGATAASEARLPLPNGLISSDATKIPTIRYLNEVETNATTALFYHAMIEPSVGYITFGRRDGSVAGLTKQNGSSLWNTGTVISFDLRIPIQGWSSTPTLLALPNGTETNYSITATGNAAQVITANVTDIPFIATTQNNLVWSGSSFTSPTDSIYQVSASINLSANAGNAFEYYINGSRVGRLYSQATGVSSIFPFSTTIAVPANSTFSIRPTVNATLSNTADHRLQITRVNGKIDKTFVGNVAKNQVAIVEYRGNSSNITLSGTAQAMPTNTVTGDSGIVSVGASSFTLQSGEYELDAGAIHYLHGGSTGSIQVESYIYNTTDNVETKRALPSYSYAYYATSFTVNPRLLTRITITKQTTFEFRHRVVSSTNFTGYLGFAFASPNDINGYVKITKLNGQ